MKVISIGTDRGLFKEDSFVYKRTISYGEKLDKLFIIVFSQKKSGLIKKNISPNVIAYPTNSLSRFTFFIDAILLARKIIKEENLNNKNTIITCQDPFESGFTGLLISKLFNLNLHIQIHADFLSPYFNYNILQRIRVLLARLVLPNTKFIRVVSKRIYDSLVKSDNKLNGVVEILPIVVDKDPSQTSGDIKTEFPGFSHYVLLISRLEKEKRVEDGILVVASVVKTFPKIGLFIAGEGREKNNLLKLVKSLGLDKNVVFLRFRRDIASLLKSSDLYLHTSAFEGYGMSLVEAGLSGTPIVTTDVGIAGEVLKNDINSLICPVSDIISISLAVSKLLSDKSLAHKLAETLKNDLDNHLISKEDYVERYVNQLERTI